MLPKVIRRKEVEERIGLACSTIYAMMSQGTFPRPLKLGHRAVGWLESDIQVWLDAKKTHTTNK